MQGGFRIGRLFGIDINIDWSWLFIFVLITWNLSALFGTLHPEWSAGLRWGIALAASLLFFASVLAHELAHSIMARMQGLPVRNITLFLFGGVSNIQRHPPSPQSEFLIAVVGPLTSILLGGAFAALGAVMANPLEAPAPMAAPAFIAALDPVTTLLLWLGPINILLGIFNLIPGFPLDGGRILRSVLWAATGSLRRATRWASWVGQAVAWLLILAGVAMIFGVSIPFFGEGFIGGLWLAFIGWFLNSAAVESYRQVLVQDLLEGVPVRTIMRPNPPTASPHSSVASLIDDYVMGTDEHAFPVQEDGRLLGMVTLEDIRRVPRERWGTTTVDQIMTPAEALVTVGAAEEADEVLSKLQERDVRQLPVVEDGRLIGLLRRRDIVRWLQLQSQPA